MPLTDEALLAAVDLACVRGDRLLFEGLSFALVPGTVLKVEGPNGAGKTSLLRVLAGLLRPEAGSVTWRGQGIAACAGDYAGDRRYVGHQNGLGLALTARENLRLAAVLQGAALDSAALDTVLETVGLPCAGDIPAVRLSSGQRRRLALARLLLGQAGVWILDEPLNALDRNGHALVGRLLTDHLMGNGVAVISTHQTLTLPAGVRQQTLTLAVA
ncbi:MAG TPA: cytochrome c biogenesis heme-transporting ATPase CcmA [Candidatus Macondimonas sp.]|nr:cytochrome c biogenesis heme-transporting ATPase CcmA [Candidatus Macondimonas sp.]